jgi:hypothetical protein
LTKNGLVLGLGDEADDRLIGRANALDAESKREGGIW